MEEGTRLTNILRPYAPVPVGYRGLQKIEDSEANSRGGGKKEERETYREKGWGGRIWSTMENPVRMQFIFILHRSIMVHRLNSLNSCFEANQGWYVFNLSFHYETVSLPRSLQVRKLCLPTQEIPLQQLPQKGNFPQK